MGLGDEIMLTAQARQLQARDPRKVAVRGKRGIGARWHEIWTHNPRIATLEEIDAGADVQWLDNYPGNRPYLDQARCTRERFVFRPYGPEPGEIHLTDEERRLGEQVHGAILIEPNVKGPLQVNKDWGANLWKQLVRLLCSQFELVQIGAGAGVQLRNVRYLHTRNTREAAAVLAGARAAVLPEGGLHHAAAALGVPAVVLFGGFISPEITGYASQVNLFTGGEPCGNRLRCPHCRAAMDAITPELVAARLRELLSQRKAA